MSTWGRIDLILSNKRVVKLANPPAIQPPQPLQHVTPHGSPSNLLHPVGLLEIHRLILPPDLRIPRPPVQPLEGMAWVSPDPPHNKAWMSSDPSNSSAPSDGGVPSADYPPYCGYTAIYGNLVGQEHLPYTPGRRKVVGNGGEAGAVRTSRLAVLRVVTCGRAPAAACARCR